MTNSEFKAWFNGFCENLDGTPNKKQWSRIKERIEEINEVKLQPIQITKEVIHRRDWWPTWVYNNGDTPNFTIGGSSCQSFKPKAEPVMELSWNSIASNIGAVEAVKLS